MVGEGYCRVPGFFPNRNVNVNTRGSRWPFVNVDNVFKNENYYNGGLLLQSQDQYLVHIDELLKQTMLKQEAIFKDQIHELHRIYWRQRELMDEMKKNELPKHHPQQGTLRSNPFLPQDLRNYAQKGSHVFSFPWLNPVVNKFSFSTAENDPSISHFNEGKFMKSVPDPVQNEFSSGCCEMESRKKFGKKIFHLERPATEYIDGEEPLRSVLEVSDSPSNRICEVVHQSEWQPFSGSGDVNLVFHGDNPSVASVSSKSTFFADLNEPIKLEELSGAASMCLPDLNEPNKNVEEVALTSKLLVDLNEPFECQEEAALPGIVHSPLAGHTDFSCQDLAQNCHSCRQVLSTALTPNIGSEKDSETCSNNLHLEKSDDEEGQRRCGAVPLSPGLETCVSLQNIELKQARQCEKSHLARQRKKSSTEGLETLGKDLSSSGNLIPVSANKVGTSQLISLSDVGNSKPYSVSSSLKHTRNIVRTPVIVQALPCFNSSLHLRKCSKSSVPGPDVAVKKFPHLKSFRSGRKFDSGSFSESSISNGSSAESKTLESNPPFIGSNVLNISEENDLTIEHQGPSKFPGLYVEVKSSSEHINCTFMLPSSSSDGEGKLEDSSRGLAWPKTMPGPKRKRVRRSNSSIKVETCLNPSEDEDVENGVRDRVSNINRDCDPVPGAKKLTSVVQSALVKKITCYEDGIDLTLCMDNDGSSPAPALSTEVDVEGPVSPENKESSPPRGDSDENQVETSSDSGNEGREDQEDLARNASKAIMSGEEKRDLVEVLSRNAATALVSISSSVILKCPERAACVASESSRRDVLYWFAKVVSTLVADPEGDLNEVLDFDENDDYECMLNELDYFEAMTLSLTETKVDDADCFKTNGQEWGNERANAVAYLPSQQKRGRTRRARQQQKDFQREILPSLASLSRHEVTEDLQLIEGLIEASNYSQRGTVCTASVSTNARVRGRKRSSIHTSNPADFTICSTSKQRTSLRKKNIEERGLIGWGRTTTRRRGQRSPAANPWVR